MSNASPGSAGQTPPPVRYPDTKGEVAHRWGAGAVALVIAVVSLVAAIVVAVIVFSGGSDKTRPAPTVPSQILTPAPTSGQPQSHTAGSRSGAEPLDYRSTVGHPSAPAFLASGPKRVDIGDGLSIVLADGWSVEDTGDNVVLLLNGDSTAELFVASGPANSSDVMSVLEGDVNHLINNGVLGNVEISEPDQHSVKSKNFQQEAAVAYTAELSTQQGTMPVNGVFLELLNTKTREAVFFDLHAISADALEAAATDVDTMINSLL